MFKLFRKKQIIPLYFLFLFFSKNVISQSDTLSIPDNSYFIEFAGLGGYGSINYERFFIRSKNYYLNVRAGIGTINLKDFTNSFNPDFIFPVLINGGIGRHHYLEVGIGQSFSYTVQANPSTYKPERKAHINSVMSIGYRFQPKKRGIFLRLSYTPIFLFNSYYRHWAGFTVGFTN